jgi:transcription initiation factor TFIIH subunit 4
VVTYDLQRKAGRFYPTRLALNIASGQNKSQVDLNQEGYIVVETNYRVYAYTDSNLQVALLGLFCELMYRQVTSLISFFLSIKDDNMNL